eukprot:Clim_evm154s147 gene=Clim_evmTU154s147
MAQAQLQGETIIHYELKQGFSVCSEIVTHYNSVFAEDSLAVMKRKDGHMDASPSQDGMYGWVTTVSQPRVANANVDFLISDATKQQLSALQTIQSETTRYLESFDRILIALAGLKKEYGQAAARWARTDEAEVKRHLEVTMLRFGNGYMVYRAVLIRAIETFLEEQLLYLLERFVQAPEGDVKAVATLMGSASAVGESARKNVDRILKAAREGFKECGPTAEGLKSLFDDESSFVSEISAAGPLRFTSPSIGANSLAQRRVARDVSHLLSTLSSSANVDIYSRDITQKLAPHIKEWIPDELRTVQRGRADSKSLLVGQPVWEISQRFSAHGLSELQKQNMMLSDTGIADLLKDMDLSPSTSTGEVVGATLSTGSVQRPRAGTASGLQPSFLRHTTGSTNVTSVTLDVGEQIGTARPRAATMTQGQDDGRVIQAVASESLLQPNSVGAVGTDSGQGTFLSEPSLHRTESMFDRLLGANGFHADLLPIFQKPPGPILEVLEDHAGGRMEFSVAKGELVELLDIDTEDAAASSDFYRVRSLQGGVTGLIPRAKVRLQSGEDTIGGIGDFELETEA